MQFFRFTGLASKTTLVLLISFLITHIGKWFLSFFVSLYYGVYLLIVCHRSKVLIGIQLKEKATSSLAWMACYDDSLCCLSHLFLSLFPSTLYFFFVPFIFGERLYFYSTSLVVLFFLFFFLIKHWFIHFYQKNKKFVINHHLVVGRLGWQ